ncbi:MAG: hypothetical protein SVU88_02900 [Candidatus Nanohaloarchaea archaeon]|nr:hypothetical protein [Candidatus Nanohaloarchaea archaeon]
MVPDIRRLGQKVKEVQPLDLRRIRRKVSGSRLRSTDRLRKHLGRTDVADDE